YALGAAFTLLLAGLIAGACTAPQDSASGRDAGASSLAATPPHIPSCVPACNAASACVPPQAPSLYDASHFACNAGVCEWKGCKSTAECTSAYQGAKLTCVKPEGAQ